MSEEVLAPNGVIAAYASDAVLEPAVPFYRLAYANIAVRHVLADGNIRRQRLLIQAIPSPIGFRSWPILRYL